ncbi:hypothetical protein PFUGPA_01071 [Plasmodium falciparum Palo Alto/Uganda]|uniref:Rifin n=2 Tax=Plasmodium falciparum TaxID=5833 RepID=W4J3V0_PLAFP|nr:hypothetical protein PFUGPA_01071 [Plasmodium falciparum Palo Alto/Uganda]ETW58820.1 hypothetical protein PFMC_05300 [Plasmodium falciparum CAMP/Malaysia]
MKLHYTKIFIFFLPLNIFVSSSYVHNKNKLHITPHTSTTTSRVLSECDLYVSSYDNDPDMKFVKENFDRQTSQRFEKYNERMKDKRQKCKEQCDKDIQEIILKDKVQKSLSEKVEKGCLVCACGLGGVAAGVGIFGALGTYGWKVAATATAMELATKEGITAGINAAIEEIKLTSIFTNFSNISWLNFIDGSNYKTVEGLVAAVTKAINSIENPSGSLTQAINRARNGISHGSDSFLDSAVKAANHTTASITENAKIVKLGEVTNASSNAYSAIGYSVTVILIIVLVMIIIYLILHYRRTKKMNKKSQYTKLLNE